MICNWVFVRRFVDPNFGDVSGVGSFLALVVHTDSLRRQRGCRVYTSCCRLSLSRGVIIVLIDCYDAAFRTIYSDSYMLGLILIGCKLVLVADVFDLASVCQWTAW